MEERYHVSKQNRFYPHMSNVNKNITIFIVAPCILTTLMFLSPTNALLYYTYKMLNYTVKISHDCSFFFLHVSVHLDYHQGAYAEPC